MSWGFRMCIARPAMPTGFSEQERKLNASTAYHTGPPAPRHPGRSAIGFGVLGRIAESNRADKHAADAEAAFVRMSGIHTIGTPCLRANVTIYSSDRAARRHSTI